MHVFREDLLLGLRGLDAAEIRVADYSDWTVTGDFAGALRVTVGHGLPFVYAQRKTDAPAVIRWDAARTVQVDLGKGSAVKLSVDGRHFGVFGPLGSRWTQEGTELVSDLNGKSHFSVAVLPDGDRATFERYGRHAYAVVQSSKVTWAFDETRASVRTRYRVDTELVEKCPSSATGAAKDECAELSAEPLLALYRHQWLHSKAELSPGTYRSPRGEMKIVAASEFETVHDVPPILPSLPLTPSQDKSRLQHLIARVLGQPTLFPQGLGEKPNNDAYWEGKSLGKLANLAHLAHELGSLDQRDQLLDALRRRLEDWFDGHEPRLFYYDASWRSLIAFPDSYGSATQLNDHHFHYGYFILAAAAVARFDEDWARKYAPMVELLIADAAQGARDSTQFPLLRAMDAYAGHSWANGPCQFEEGNNQEASSEDLNFSAATLLWGALRQNRELEALGAFLFAQQVAAVEQYWFDVDRAVFPKNFTHPTVAMVWGAGGKYDTWFDQDPTVIHGINFLPLTGASLYLGRRPQYVRRNFDVLLQRSHGEITTWRDYILMYLAVGDPALAREHFDRDPYFEPEFGSSLAYTRHWIEAWQDLGRLEPQVTADVVTHAVFSRDGRRQHVAFNPDRKPRRIRFSDGQSFVAAPRSLVVR
jgi:endoglucanase Acf2